MTSVRVFTWHVHGNYLYYLAHCREVEFILPVRDGRPHGYGGRTASFPWPENVREVHVDDLARERFDVVLFQSRPHYLDDQFQVLTDEQRCLPQVYLEHDPPREGPVDQRHPFAEPDGVLVHVTPFNQLMWDSGRTPATVIEHGVPDLGYGYTGAKERGIVVFNDISTRGRRVGADVWERFRSLLPLDLVGMNSTVAGGLGEVPPARLSTFCAPYRFFFHPARYTSLGLALCEAMMLGLPVVGLGTTELPTVISNGVNGFVDTRLERLVEGARHLLAEPEEARRMGLAARETARDRFSIERFTADWTRLFRQVAAKSAPVLSRAGGGS